MKAIERVFKYIEYRNLNKSELERKAGISNGYLAKQLQRKADIGESILNGILENCPDISAEWLLTGNGEMLKSTEPKHLALRDDENSKAIYLYDFEAAAGHGTFEAMMSKENVIGKYIIPEFAQADWMIYVKGSSMYPKYSSGDIIACRVLHESRFVQWGKVYVVATREQGVLVKRLEEEYEDSLLAVSDNPAYKPFKIPKDEIVGIALVVGVVRLE